MLGEERWRQWEMFQWKLWDVWSWMDAMNLPLYVRILPPIYAPIVWLLYILYIYIYHESIISNEQICVFRCLVLPYASFCLEILLLGPSSGCRCEQSNQTYSNCTGLEFICLRGQFVSVEKVFDWKVWPTDRTKTGMISCIIPNYTHVFSGEVTNNLHKRFPANFWGISLIQDGFFIGHLYIYTTR